MPDPDGAPVTLGYYVNDLLRFQTTDGSTRTWDLDPAQRFSTATTTGASGTTVKTNHYAGDGDTPEWIDESNNPGDTTRNIVGLDGDLTATAHGTAIALQLVDLHGDVVATLDVPSKTDVATAASFRAIRSDEFGNPIAGTINRCGWLGAKQRSTETLTGATLMGVRLCVPSLGRFLSVDPIPGGNDTTYVYPADPINKFDTDGKAWWSRVGKALWDNRDGIAFGLGVAGMLGCALAGWHRWPLPQPAPA